MRLSARIAANGNRHHAIPTLFPAAFAFEDAPLTAVSETSPFLGGEVDRREGSTPAYRNRVAAARELGIPDAFQAYDVRIPDHDQDPLHMYDMLHSNLMSFANQGERARVSASVVKAREVLMKRMAYRAYGNLTAEELTDLSHAALSFEPETARYFASLADATKSSVLIPPRP